MNWLLMKGKNRNNSSARIGRLARGRHHLIVKQTVWEDGFRVKRPVLWLLLTEADGTLRTTPYEPLLQYYAENSARCYAWMKNTARGLGALIDHSIAIGSLPEFVELRRNGNLERRLLRGLAKALRDGTLEINKDGRATDRSGLYWTPLGERQAGVILAALTGYFRWLRDEPSAAKWVQAASTDRLADHPRIALRLASALLIKKSNSLLGHLNSAPQAPSHSFLGIVEKPNVSSSAVPTFPARYIGSLLYHCFQDERKECDEAALIISHLLFLLGIRMSEAFHLYTSDVQFVGDTLWIFFHHPDTGKITHAGSNINRREYLHKFGLVPRNVDLGRNHAGWKGMAGDDKGTPGYALPIHSLRRRVAGLLKRYLYVTRPAIMARRPRSSPDHPFLLVSSARALTATGGDVGDPYTMAAFNYSWEQAMGRLGRRHDVPALVKPLKSAGTTPHGARHFYGRFLVTSGVKGEIIRACMHHKTLLAHLVYTRLTPSEINEVMTDAAEGEPVELSMAKIRDRFVSEFYGSPTVS